MEPNKQFYLENKALVLKIQAENPQANENKRPKRFVQSLGKDFG